jgi:hypothetical protein
VVYDASVIDNQTGAEIIAQSGRDCEEGAAEAALTGGNK